MSPNPRPTIRVLVADDDPGVRAALADLIRDEEGLELVAAAADATEAIAAAEEQRPDVAIVDVRMPGGGLAATRGIREVSPGTRVVALSAQRDRNTVFEMLEAGASGYLIKGGTIEAIVDSIKGAASGLGSLSGEVTVAVIEGLVDQLSARRSDTERRDKLEEKIRRAIDAEGVLEIVHQPIYALVGGHQVGVEALSRFHLRPSRTPDLWFAAAEEVGLRVELEIAAVAKAVAGMELLPLPLYLSVNASPAVVVSSTFQKIIRSCDCSRIVVEITEHARIDDYGRLDRALGKLRALGVRLAIDDAGAGFASLRHILQLAPDLIKLDRSLIQGIDHERSQQALAAGLISFADRIDATIVAEGIEHPRQVDALTALGVAYGQGYHLGRPGPPATR
jgi:EAL domain-containing protein (putative c-di-GMP-specific phosphodiesterase class I)/DNA-binding NarL/FixJ family response regulator